MTRLLHAGIDAIGLLGPGLHHWEQARPIFAGLAPWHPETTRVPPPAALPPAERRRCGIATKAALGVAQQALATASAPDSQLATVFTSSGGDGVNCHEICAALASEDRSISPTRFHNSVLNAPAGYWSISTGTMAPATVLCAHDGSFAAGLLEAMTQVQADERPVLLLAYDTSYPEPLFGLRPIPDAFGVALLLTPAPGTSRIGRITLDPASCLTDRPADTCRDAGMEQLRASIPAARCLPLLHALARSGTTNITLGYLDGLQMQVSVDANAD
ncbi:beta-ketoacyl synthase chain length factor [Ramlibacter sp. PS3R-8]|uniref:beta-ketoacyl synthase chain length factor n=1 Tax=Ramlibacter sp. PS3R-8 TaxID=3133437 RepID=UPI0030A6CC84